MSQEGDEGHQEDEQGSTILRVMVQFPCHSEQPQQSSTFHEIGCCHSLKIIIRTTYEDGLMSIDERILSHVALFDDGDDDVEGDC